MQLQEWIDKANPRCKKLTKEEQLELDKFKGIFEMLKRERKRAKLLATKLAK